MIKIKPCRFQAIVIIVVRVWHYDATWYKKIPRTRREKERAAGHKKKRTRARQRRQKKRSRKRKGTVEGEDAKTAQIEATSGRLDEGRVSV